MNKVLDRSVVEYNRRMRSGFHSFRASVLLCGRRYSLKYLLILTALLTV